MPTVTEFGTTQDVAITILMDNRADLIVKSTKTIKYFTRGPLLAEHGLAALVHLRAAGLRILWDAGLTRGALPENMRRMLVIQKATLPLWADLTERAEIGMISAGAAS